MGNIISAIAGAINAVISAIASFFMAIFSGIASVLVAIWNFITCSYMINISSPDPITRILYTPSLPPLTSIATRLRIYIDKYNFCSNASMIYVAVLGYDMQRLNFSITLNSSPNTESIPKLFLNKRLGWPSACVNLPSILINYI
ncbi:hypothetical protein I308_106340 [Cryptococcus tetragattii IND107]|uniref:Uncharacterized protein n=1 Tax=Cryptococcus tetragattii IND107 TaxID=1296105 RepID=A0ABR3BIM3_9TREE